MSHFQLAAEMSGCIPGLHDACAIGAMQVYRYGALHIGGGRRKEALNDLSISIISFYERVMAAGCNAYMIDMMLIICL